MITARARASQVLEDDRYLKDQDDGAEPSANSVALLDPVRLGNLSGEKGLLEKGNTLMPASSRATTRWC